MADLVLCGLAFLLGVASHICYFNRGEHHFYGLTYLNSVLLIIAGVTGTLYKGYGFDFLAALSAALAIVSSALAGLYTSLFIYRIFFHPLNRFPGPWRLRLSGFFWNARLKNSDAYYQLKTLHDQYGDFVRISPNILSIVDPEGMEVSYGVHAKASKSPWYEGDYPLSSMHTTRSKPLHDKRRRVWAPAFSDKALREYETQVNFYNDKMIKRLSEFKNGPVDVTKWFNLYSFDVMGRLAFGKDYGMLDSGEKHWALELLSEGMEPLALQPATWLFRVLAGIPGLAAGYYKFIKFCTDELAGRVHNDGKKGSDTGSDIMGWLLKAYKEVEHPERDPMLQADSRLIIVAGSDTTAATMTSLFYHLAQEPEHAAKIREELRSTIDGEWTDKDIHNLPHLNGAINEALRLHPPVPSGVQRTTPKEGMHIGETYIPGNVHFWMPQYVMGRDNRTYPNADSFMPERWYSKPDMIRHKEAFAPFSMGPFGCIGKNLAYMELRTLTARILLEYDFKLAPGEDGTRLLTKMKDHFTVDMGSLDLVFTPLKP